MYPLHLPAADRRAYNRALRADYLADAVADDAIDEDQTADPNVGDTPTPAQPDPGANPMRLVTANVKHTMTRAKIEADVKVIRDLGSIIMWQEVHSGVYADAIRQHLPAADWQHSFLDKEIPISVKRSAWTVQQATAYKMHDRYPGGGDPARYIGATLVQSTTSAVQFLVPNCHFVANAWNDAPRPHKAWKRDRWNLTYSKFHDLVLDARSKGITVVGGGDWNKHDVPKFDAAQTWLRTAHVDYLFGLQATGGATFTQQSNQSVSLNSDHNALVSQLSWTAGANTPVGTYFCSVI